MEASNALDLLKNIDKLLIEDQYLLLKDPVLTGSRHLTHSCQEKVNVCTLLYEVSEERHWQVLIVKKFSRLLLRQVQ